MKLDIWYLFVLVASVAVFVGSHLMIRRAVHALGRAAWARRTNAMAREAASLSMQFTPVVDLGNMLCETGDEEVVWVEHADDPCVLTMRQAVAGLSLISRGLPTSCPSIWFGRIQGETGRIQLRNVFIG